MTGDKERDRDASLVATETLSDELHHRRSGNNTPRSKAADNDADDDNANNSNHNSSGNVSPSSGSSVQGSRDISDADAEDYVDSDGNPKESSIKKPLSSRGGLHLRQKDTRAGESIFGVELTLADLEQNTWFIPYSQLDMRNSKVLGKGRFPFTFYPTRVSC